VGVEITFELSEEDLQHFAIMAREAAKAVDPVADEKTILAAARDMLSKADIESAPAFITTRLDKLENIANMVDDREWKLEGEDHDRVLRAIAYFADPEDLIADRVPGIGFLDDAIMVELVAADLEEEIAAFVEFDDFRTAEEQRRENQGLETHVGREDWLADKRAVLHHRMRERRRARVGSGSRSIRLW
jgi:uncharacterized membrane protein YkvA (DUF1232 family)